MDKNVKQRNDKPKGNVKNPNALQAWEIVFGKLAVVGMSIAIGAFGIGWIINFSKDIRFRKQQFKKVAKNG